MAVIERVISRDEETKVLLLTAEIRGWVEVLHEDLPTGLKQRAIIEAQRKFALNSKTHNQN